MSKVRCVEAFHAAGYPAPVNVGDVKDDNDQLVLMCPHRFVPVDDDSGLAVAEVAPVEQATAAPGEKRHTRRRG